MWDPEHFPGVDNVPWQLLIRARFTHELDAVLASVVVERVGAVASVQVTRKVAEVAAGAVAVRGDKATSAGKVRTLSAIAELDDWCGTTWPRPWPPRRNGALEDLGDPMTVLVVEQALAAVRAGGSEQLQKSLGEVLAEVGSLRG